MYINKSDYYTRITEDKLTALIENKDSILTDAEKQCKGLIKGFLGAYKIADEFEKTADDRNFMVLSWGLNIALYFIYKRCQGDEVPENVIKDYDDTMLQLLAISKGKQNIDIDRITSDSGEITTSRRIGSQTPRSHRF